MHACMNALRNAWHVFGHDMHGDSMRCLFFPHRCCCSSVIEPPWCVHTRTAWHESSNSCAHASDRVLSIHPSASVAQRGVAVDQALQGQSQQLAEIARDLTSCRSESFIQEQAAQSR